MAATNTYTWPTSAGTNNFVLTTDGSGGLTWQSVVGAGGIQKQGTPVAGQVSFFVNENTIAGDTSFSWATTTGTLTISGAGGIKSALYTSTATTTIGSGTGGIILDPASGKIILASGDWIETYQGYQIGKGGIQVLREMIPILGFDLPAQTATTSYVKVSRKIENYPFASAAAGTTRVHKLVIRYTDDLPTASSTDWRVATTTGASYYDFTISGCNNTALDSGKTGVTTTTIPTDGTPWWLDIKIPSAQSGKKIRVFEIFLAAYDQIQ